MKTQIENLKQELREFIELSKKATPPSWEVDDGDGYGSIKIFADTQLTASLTTVIGDSSISEFNAAFIARSRNISPTMAECLLVAVNGLDRLYDDTEGCADGAPDAADHDKLCNEVAHAAKFHLQQILTIWEAAK